MVEALRLPVADGAVGEQRGVASPAGLQERIFAADIEAHAPHVGMVLDVVGQDLGFDNVPFLE